MNGTMPQATAGYADNASPSAVETLVDELALCEDARLELETSSAASTGAAAAPRETGLAESVVMLLGLSIAQRVIGLGRGIVVCMWMTPALLGPWDLANRFFFLAAPFVVLGLPGTFGRYVEHYRLRGMLRGVLRKLLIASAACALGGCLVMELQPAFFADLFFGRPDEIAILRLSAVCLAAVVAYNTLTELLNALRLVRANALLQFGNTVAFAVLSVVFLVCWRADAWSVIAAFGAACALGVLCGGAYLARVWRGLPADTQRASLRELLRKLLPFAAWVWVSNLLTNSLESSTRYMMLHESGLTDQTAIDAMVGNYHASQLIPNLMITLGAMLSGVLLPHLARDWERDRRDRVSRTMNFALKLIGLGAFAAAVLVTWCGPLLFNVLLGGKYPDARNVLTLTLAGAVWAAIAMVAGVYLWCAERARVGCLALASGLIVNVALNGLWLPEFGLSGAATASALAAGTVTAALFLSSAWCGFHIDRRMLLTTALPVTLLLGALPAGLMLGATAALAWFRPGELFTAEELARLGELVAALREKLVRGRAALRS